jgi:hypothetical protein
MTLEVSTVGVNAHDRLEFLEDPVSGPVVVNGAGSPW